MSSNDVNSVKFNMPTTGNIEYPNLPGFVNVLPSAPNMTDSTEIGQSNVDTKEQPSRFQQIKDGGKKALDNVVDVTKTVAKSTVDLQTSDRLATQAVQIAHNLSNFLEDAGFRFVSRPVFADDVEINTPRKNKVLDGESPYADEAYVTDKGAKLYEKTRLNPFVNFKELTLEKEDANKGAAVEPGVRISNAVRRQINNLRADIITTDRIASKAADVATRVMMGVMIGRLPLIGRALTVIVAAATRLVVGTLVAVVMAAKNIFKLAVVITLAAIFLALQFIPVVPALEVYYVMSKQRAYDKEQAKLDLSAQGAISRSNQNKEKAKMLQEISTLRSQMKRQDVQCDDTALRLNGMMVSFDDKAQQQFNQNYMGMKMENEQNKKQESKAVEFAPTKDQVVNRSFLADIKKNEVPATSEGMGKVQNV